MGARKLMGNPANPPPQAHRKDDGMDIEFWVDPA